MTEHNPVDSARFGFSVSDGTCGIFLGTIFCNFVNKRIILEFHWKISSSSKVAKRISKLTNTPGDQCFIMTSFFWLLHRRFRCTEYSKIFASIDPKFLSQFQSIFVESIPFIASSHTPGIHNNIILQFCKLAKNKCLFSTFVDMIN